MEAQIHQSLKQLGVSVKQSWVRECISFCQRDMASSSATNRARQSLIDRVFDQFLVADLNLVGEGCLNTQISAQHNVVLEGKFVLQADELSNISERKENRDARPPKSGAGVVPVLKISLTDGKTRLSGIEFQHIKNLWTALPGVKIAVSNALIWRGALLLSPENTQILGGQVASLVDLHLGRISVSRNAADEDDENAVVVRPFKKIIEIIESPTPFVQPTLIKATIRSIVGDLSWVPTYSAILEIDDGTALLRVCASARLIERLIGMDAATFARSTDQGRIDRSQEASNSLKNFEGSMTIAYNQAKSMYDATDIEEASVRDVRAFCEYLCKKYPQLKGSDDNADS